MLKDQIEILLVEDHPEDLDLTVRALKDAHICNRIQVARDGEEALEFLFCQGPHSHRGPNCRPRLILLDLKLPKVDGLEALEQIKRDPRTRAVPVVILTSSKLEQDPIQGYHLGANSLHSKAGGLRPVPSDHQESGLLLAAGEPAAALAGLRRRHSQ
jgi:two-component system response regulator